MRGKTTLLRMIAGLSEPTAGNIEIRGNSVIGVPPNKRPVNLIFQNLALFPMMNVGENIAFGLKRRGEKKAAIRKKVAAILERVDLAGFENKAVDQLSGGQRQRVAIARCLVLEPAVLLLDEPLGALDLKLREQMKVELKKLQAKVGTTFIYITHDQSEALVMSDFVAVMNQSAFEQIDTPSNLYGSPRTPFVARFVGDSNAWRGRVRKCSGETVEIETDDGQVFLTRGSAFAEKQPRRAVPEAGRHPHRARWGEPPTEPFRGGRQGHPVRRRQQPSSGHSLRFGKGTARGPAPEPAIRPYQGR